MSKPNLRPLRPAALAALVFLLAVPGQLAAGRPETENVKAAISLAVAAEYEAALALFRAELAQQPDDPLLNYYVGVTRYKLGQIDGAIVHLEKSTLENAPFPQAFYWLAQAYLDKNRREAAEDILRQGLARFPLNRDLKALASELSSR